MKKTINKYLVLICLCCLPGLLLAQGSKTMIRGVVVSEFDKEGLPSANVLLMNKDNRVINHAATDLDGNFSILAEPKAGDKLVISYMGYKKQEILIKDKTTFRIEMQDDAVMLEGAVITAERRVNTGMLNVNEKDLTVSAKRISIAELADDMTGANIEDALQGRIAGVDIVGGGAPGVGMDIRIRGTSSINGNSQPLIVVDGFPFETEVSSDFDFASADEEEYSQMLSVAPEDILEITVLKDAAATAIWGSKGANGVLQITTKRGTVSKPRVSYTLKTTFTEKAKSIPTLTGDEYSTMIQEALFNSGQLYDPKAYPEFAYDINQPYYFYNYGQNTDWYDAVSKTGFIHDHNVSISGGGAKAQYRASVSYFDQTGTTLNTDLTRITTRLNVDYNISEKIKVKASMAYTHSDNNQNYITYLDKNVDVTNMAYNRMPNMSIYEYNHLGQLTGNYFSPVTSPQGQWSSTAEKGGMYNPVAMAKEGMYKKTSDRIISNFSLTYRPFEWLRYQLDVGLDMANDKSKAFLPQTATGRPWNEISVNRADEKDNETFSMQTFNKLLFNPTLGKNHTFTGVLGVSTTDKTTLEYRATTGNNASPYLTDPSNPSRVTESDILGIYSKKIPNRSMSVYADTHYGFLDRYFVGANIRTESSSRFGENYRWGTFPSASVRWRLSGEPFMKKLTGKFLDELSFRYSFGINGNQPKYDFRYVSLYSIYDWTYLGEAGVYPESLEGVNLRWEKSTQHNFGINLAVLKNRINIEFDYYKKRSSDQFFYGLTIPSTTGFSKTDINEGIMDNEGWELSVNTKPYTNKNWRITFNFNIAHNENTIREYPSNSAMEKGSTISNGKYLRRFEFGQPIGSFYGYRYKGVYLNEDQTIARDASGNKIYTYDDSGTKIPVQMRFGYPSIDYVFQPGDAKYEDINNDGNIDYQDIVYLGNSNPRFTGGFGPSIKYKNITVNLYFNFRYGNDIMNNAKMNLENMYTFNNQSTAVLKRWRHPYEDESTAPTDLLPRALYKKGYNYLGSDRYVEDGSFLRWKSMTVKYTFPKKMLEKTFLQDASIGATASNLYLWTKYTGLDPEVKLKSDPFSGGTDDARVPRSRDITITFNATF